MEWLAPVLLFVGMLISELRHALLGRRTASASEVTANAHHLSALYSRLEVVEVQAAKVPMLEAKLSKFEVENRMLREYVAELQRIMREAGLSVPEISWPQV